MKIRTITTLFLTALILTTAATVLAACSGGSTADTHTHIYNGKVHEPTCSEQGYTEYACRCGDKYIDDYTDTVDHQPSTPHKENIVPSTCTTTGTYDEVTTCKFCYIELSRTPMTSPLAAHTAGRTSSVTLQNVTCQTDGRVETKVYCAKCDEVIDTTITTTPAVPHEALPPVEENFIAADCVTIGSHDVVQHCKYCNTIVASETITEGLAGHTPDEPVAEDVVESTYLVNGHCYMRTYCKSCHALLDESLELLGLKPKETPTYTLPTDIVVYTNSVLSFIRLPEGFTLSSNNPLSISEPGEYTLNATYTEPNDTEGRYLKVNVVITITVVKPTITNFRYDENAFENLVYDGKPVQSPYIYNHSNYATIAYYEGGKKLDCNPTLPGEYDCIITVEDPSYATYTETIHFTIAKYPTPLEDYKFDYVVQDCKIKVDKAYKYADEVTFVITNKNTNVVYSENDALPAGEYTITVSKAEDKVSLAQTVTFEFVVGVDNVAPELTWPEYNGNVVYINGITGYFEDFPFVDDSPIVTYLYGNYGNSFDFYYCEGRFPIEAGQTYQIRVKDAYGNASKRATFSVKNKNDNTAPVLVYPEKGAVINVNSFAFSAKDTDDCALRYYYAPAKDFDTNWYWDHIQARRDGWVANLEDGEYCWYAVDSNDNHSEVRTFTVSHKKTGTITPVYPIGDVCGERLYFKAISDNPIDYYVYYPAGSKSRNQTSSFVNTYYYAEYEWYAVDIYGNESEKVRFRNHYRGNFDNDYYFNLTYFEDGANEIYWNYDVFHYSLTDTPGYAISHILCLVDNADKVDARYAGGVWYGDRYQRDISFNKNLVNNDTIYFRIGTDDYVYSAFYIVHVDLEAPKVGNVTTADGVIDLTLGSDNTGARYYYSFDMINWIEYDTDIKLNGDKHMHIALRAVDLAGNETIDVKLLYDLAEESNYTVKSGVLNQWTNQNVVLQLQPVDGMKTYYVINNGSGLTTTYYNLDTQVTISYEGETVFYTYMEDSFGNVTYSQPALILIDKTAPVIGEGGLLYRTERFNFNTQYEFMYMLKCVTTDEHKFEYYYKFRDIDNSWKLLTDRIPLFTYYLAHSGTYYIDIIAKDEAGNESEVISAPILTDVKGPVMQETDWRMKYAYDENGKFTGIYVKFEWEDDYGAVYSVNYQLWDQEAYDNGGVSYINVLYYTECTSNKYTQCDFISVEKLRPGMNYYRAYVCDEYINGSYTDHLYYFELDESLFETVPSDTDSETGGDTDKQPNPDGEIEYDPNFDFRTGK